MSVPFAAVITPLSIIFTAPSGKTHTIDSDNPVFSDAKKIVKEIGWLNTNQASTNQSVMDQVRQSVAALVEKLIVLVTPAAKIAKMDGHGRVTVEHGVVYYGEMPVHSALTDRIIWGLDEEFNMNPYIAFLENVMQNPSKRAVDELFTFVENNKMGITDDGYILGYKRVRGDFKDIWSGKHDNSPGKILSMPRNQVNDDPNQTCSDGYHFCSQSYLPNYGAGEGNKIVIVKVNPADVVSVPVDYNAAKVRCCRYEVLSEYEGSDKEDLLAARSVWASDSDFDMLDNHQGSRLDSSFFHKGDKVRCIDVNENYFDDQHVDLVLNRVYTVLDVNDETNKIQICTIHIDDDDAAPRWFDDFRFEHVEDDDDSDKDPLFDPENNDDSFESSDDDNDGDDGEQDSAPRASSVHYGLLTDMLSNFDPDRHQRSLQLEDAAPNTRRLFLKNDRVRCVDDTGLGQTDIHKGGIYTVDEIEYDDHTRSRMIFIGVVQNIGRYYPEWRFELVEDDFRDEDAPISIINTPAPSTSGELKSHETPCTYPALEYDRGFDSGYAKGVIDAADSNVHFDNEPKAHSADEWGNGFVDGWVLAMRNGRLHPQEEQVVVEQNPSFEDPSFDSNLEGVVDYGTFDLDVESFVEQVVVEGSPNVVDADMSINATVDPAVVRREPDVATTVAQPMAEIKVNKPVTFDPKSGNFKIAR